MLSFIQPGAVVVDVGANIGATAIPSAIAAGPSGTILAFEPHPRVFRYLRENVRMNHLENCELLNFALGNKKGPACLSDMENDDCNVLGDNCERGVTVSQDVLDSFTGDLESIDLLKIDSEGYELFVLKGARETLKKTKLVCVEISELQLKRFGCSVSEVIWLLEDAGFTCHRIENGGIGEKITSQYSPSCFCENIIGVAE